MKARGAVSAALASAGILLAGWQAGAQVAEIRRSVVATSAGTNAGTTSGGATSGPGSASSGSSDSAAAAESSGSSGAGAAAAGGGTYAGAAVQTRFGTVQVQITVKSGVITDVTALHLTDDDRKSVQISNRAAPLLRSEVLAAQSANVQTISGATVTSDGYLTSLQAAIDAANL
ncbi:FMN-binding protein [Arthrobacter sp. ISL-48]|uniref:FMN-binding protein n=1 Tax=Arthrobacter sp. ISL-48 TaxID=2819110 RepID=UPI001BE600C7|nr:FMN-binding protein [Arthrobacter sp. ISL-48]MBT2533724.1 FMN-binding protein [Arthrobacter sp. ISL-48]